MRLEVGLAIGALLAVAAGSVVPFVRRRRKDPKEKERRRRELVSTNGRVIEGYAIGFTDTVVEYSYNWRGVRYDASQDISDYVVVDSPPQELSGPVAVKFLRDSPANSILIADGWSGIPALQRSMKSAISR